ncbi:TetR/AcrR family transcriptional regulator [Streptomyces sp. DSM 44915]|uniref:TetR/AcrR family transcriptional regulator n=1 Tax=Streptomyces chisholmiae TaxID=3075540 RepID=A0ABU2JR05_9ACTN|nr:TetR/AcrR family transcriptional regulator [Streptomyces sp. DSM 44915]MDT0267401.1 TetR/AcrR family transcriptional regulator [Streptomyces sp. DSM 44915]
MPGKEHAPTPPAPQASADATGATDAALDVRTRRTRARLREAVLRLAAEGPVEDIAVADLVRAARVNRTTFYKHATSPAAVLEQVLYAELDEVRAGWIADVEAARLPVEAIWERASTALIAHLERHDAVYTAGLVGRRSAILHHLLVDHFTASVRALLDRDPGLLPAGEGPREWRVEAHSAFLAHGEAGLVEAWLSRPAPREHRLFVAAAAAALPPWLATASGHGGR